MRAYPHSSRDAFEHDHIVAGYTRCHVDGLEPEVPREAPCLKSATACRVVVDHWRRRKTGPQQRLLVIHCKSHDRYFTVYAPGLAPYLRAPMLVVSATGLDLQGDSEGSGTETHSGHGARFESSYFSPVLEMAHNSSASSFDGGFQANWRSTQVRQVERALDWLGLASNLTDDGLVERAHVLGLETLRLTEASLVARSGGLREQAEAIDETLGALPHEACLAERLAWAGHLAGFWGEPWHSDAGIAHLRLASFQVSRRAAPAAIPRGVNRPTTSPDSFSGPDR